MSFTGVAQRRQKGYILQQRSIPNSKRKQEPESVEEQQQLITTPFTPTSSTSTSTATSTNIIKEAEKLPLDRNSEEYLLRLIQSIFADQLGIETKNLKGNPLPVQDYLPALTSSSEFDNQLYALIGLLLRQFVISWYSRISVDEQKEFLKEIIAICAHLTRSLQERARRVDWGTVLFDDLFILLEQHMNSLQVAKDRVGSKFSVGCGEGDESNEFIENYMNLNPHFAIQICDPVKERQYSQVLMKCVVAMLLPFEERDSKLTRSFTTSLFNDVVIKNIVENLSDNFMIWDLFGGIIGSIGNRRSQASAEQEIKTTEDYKKKYLDLLAKVGRSLSHAIAYSTSVFSSNKPDPDNLPTVSSFAVFSFIEQLFSLKTRFPFITTYVDFLFTNLLNKSNKFKHLSKNVLNNIVYNKILTGGNLSMLIKVLRGTFFPTDLYFNTEPRFIPTTQEELSAAKTKNKDRIVKAINPDSTLCKTLGIDESKVETFLNSFDHKLINKVLLWNILDLVFANLFPELMTQGSDQIISRS